MAPDFRRLFDLHAGYVLRRLRWLGVPDRDRLDLAQDVFLDIARNLARLDPARDPKPWILTITCNKARDYLTRASVRREDLEGLDVDLASEDRSVDRLAAARTLQLCFASLAYEHREVLLLVLLEEHTATEAAQILGLKVKTVESRLARARDALEAAAARLQAVERRQLGEVAAVPLVPLDIDALVRTAREAPEDVTAEVELLRGSLTRALAKAVRSPAEVWASATLTGRRCRGTGSGEGSAGSGRMWGGPSATGTTAPTLCELSGESGRPRCSRVTISMSWQARR